MMIKMPKKVLFLITKGNFGGAQRYVFDIATHLPKDRFEVVVACGEPGLLGEKLSQQNIRTITIQGLGRDVQWFKDPTLILFSILKILKQEHPDVVHLNSAKVGGIGSFAARLSKIPHIIFTAHGFAFNEDRNIFSKVVIRFAIWLTIIFSHKTICVAKNTKGQINNWPFIKNKLTVIHNGIRQIDFLSQNAAREEIASMVKERTIIGSIAELHKNKGLDFLIRAMALLGQVRNDVALVIVGNGEEKENLDKLAKKLGVDNKIYFAGFKKEAAKYLKAFDIFVLSSRTEAFPYALLEAGLAKIPVIASRVGGIPEIIDNEKDGLLVPPGKPAEIERALRFLIENPTTAKNFGQRLEHKIKKEFNLEKMLEETIKIYEAN